jgi:hypothetical protein
VKVKPPLGIFGTCLVAGLCRPCFVAVVWVWPPGLDRSVDIGPALVTLLGVLGIVGVWFDVAFERWPTVYQRQAKAAEEEERRYREQQRGGDPSVLRLQWLVWASAQGTWGLAESCGTSIGTPRASGTARTFPQ